MSDIYNTYVYTLRKHIKTDVPYKILPAQGWLKFTQDHSKNVL